jgi:hypothetical protein
MSAPQVGQILPHKPICVRDHADGRCSVANLSEWWAQFGGNIPGRMGDS